MASLAIFTRMILTAAILSGYIDWVSCTVFHQFRKVASGTSREITLFLRDKPQGGDYLVFDDQTGQQLDIDFRPAESARPLDTQAEPAVVDAHASASLPAR